VGCAYCVRSITDIIQEMLQLLGLVSGILSGVSIIPYIRDILFHTTKPERASWLIWLVLGFIAFFSQLAEGATWSLWLTGIDTIGVFLVFVLSIRYGVGGVTKRDIIALIAAGIGLILWYFTQHAAIALLITILIDVTGVSLTVIKAYEDPTSETLSTWVIIAIAGLLGMISVGKFDIILLSYPFYIFLANFVVAIAILLGRRKSMSDKKK
jgi:hypothetical protein